MTALRLLRVGNPRIGWLTLRNGQNVWQFTARQRQVRLHAIKSGNDGSCGGSYLCTAGTHQYKTYSGPGGWGSPKTVKAL